MRYENERDQDRLELGSLNVGDVLCLDFRRTAEGRAIQTIEMEIREQLEKTVKVEAIGGPLEWDYPVECEILPLTIGSISIKAAVVRGHRLNLAFNMGDGWRMGDLPVIVDYHIETLNGIRVDNWPGSK